MQPHIARLSICRFFQVFRPRLLFPHKSKPSVEISKAQVPVELKNYIEILWRRKWVILLTLIVTVTVVAIGTRLTTPVYQATAVLRIAVSSGGPLNYQEYAYADQLMNTYVEMATRRPVLEELTKRLALGAAPEIKAEIIPNMGGIF